MLEGPGGWPGAALWSGAASGGGGVVAGWRPSGAHRGRRAEC